MLLADNPRTPPSCRRRFAIVFGPIPDDVGMPARTPQARNPGRQLFGALGNHAADCALAVAKKLREFPRRPEILAIHCRKSSDKVCSAASTAKRASVRGVAWRYHGGTPRRALKSAAASPQCLANSATFTSTVRRTQPPFRRISAAHDGSWVRSRGPHIRNSSRFCGHALSCWAGGAGSNSSAIPGADRLSDLKIIEIDGGEGVRHDPT